jgi:hypothetical protein
VAAQRRFAFPARDGDHQRDTGGQEWPEEVA